MKTHITYSLLAAAMACGMAHGAATAYTTPVGYVTTPISKAFSASSAKNNVIAPLLQNSASWAGTVASISGNKLNLTSAALTVGAYNQLGLSFIAYAYYVQGADGYWAQIASNDATSITLQAGAAANFTVAENVIIRKHITINSYFGATNTAGLKPSPGGDTAEADNIVLIDEVNGGTTTIIASNAIGGTWITDAFEEAGEVPIYPDQGMQVIRRGLTDLSVVTSGEVDVLPRQIGVDPGVQIRPYAIPVNTTLTSLNLFTGLPSTGVVASPDGDTAKADIVTILTAGTPTNYFYSTVDLGGGVGWYDDGLGFVGADIIPAGSGLIIKRSNPTNSSAFVWVRPKVTISTP